MRHPSERLLDSLWRDVIRLMYGNMCAKCGRDGHDCHHIIRRADRRHRWHPLNGVLLCSVCHNDAHDRPVEFTEWLRQWVPQAYLHCHGPRSGGFDPKDRSAIKTILRGLRASLASPRDSGHDGKKAGEAEGPIIYALVYLHIFTLVIAFLIGLFRHNTNP